MDTNDRLLSVGGQASYPIWQLRGLMSGQADPMGVQYFVDGNVSATGDGSLEHPFSTLTEAAAVSHAEIALSANRHWARRNTIWVCGDTLVEDLVAFPQKTDIIGVGSYDANKMVGITGTHAPVNTAYGTRFFNVWWKGKAAANPIITLTSACVGVEFLGCMFDGVVGTVTSGILNTASSNMRVVGCRFIGAFATSNISFGAGALLSVEILKNKMFGAAAGIIVNSAATLAYSGFINGNIIRATGLCIDDDADIFVVTNNECLSDVASTTTATLEEVIDANTALGSNNRISCGDVKNAPWPVVDVTGSV